METIHARLKKFRHQHGLTIQEVSNRTKIPASTYKEWENGRQIRGEPYVLLADLYQVSLQELITGRKSDPAAVMAKLDGIQSEMDQLRKALISLL